MIEIRNILCPVDFSDFSERAHDLALAVAGRYGSQVTVLHVYPGAPPFAYAAGVPPLGTLLTPAERERLTSDLRRFANGGETSHVHVQPVVREGDTVREILDVAASVKADLLVVGTHGRSGFERLLLGSVTEKLLRKACRPVLTVPGQTQDTPQARPELFKRILCPIDFSSCSMAGLRYAMSIAEENDAELVVVYVVPNDLVPLPGQSPSDGPDQTISIADFFIRREEHVRRLLAEAVPQTVRTYCRVETILAHGKPSTQIMRLASEHHSDLIVIGVRGRGSADVMVFGSTTQQVVRQATCPVLTIREG